MDQVSGLLHQAPNIESKKACTFKSVQAFLNGKSTEELVNLRCKKRKRLIFSVYEYLQVFLLKNNSDNSCRMINNMLLFVQSHRSLASEYYLGCEMIIRIRAYRSEFILEKGWQD